MYNIERVLQELKFKKVKEYDSGVIVYNDHDTGRECEAEVALFPSRKVYEVTIHNPFSITLTSTKNPNYNEIMNSQKALIDMILARAEGLRNELSILEPFEEWRSE